MYHIFIHSSVDGPLGCIDVSAVVNSADVNTGGCVSSDQSFLRICAQEWAC